MPCRCPSVVDSLRLALPRARRQQHKKAMLKTGFMKLAGHQSDAGDAQVKPVLMRIIDESARRAKRDR